MFNTTLNDHYIQVNYHSDEDKVSAWNHEALLNSGIERVHHWTLLGGYRYPILDWISEEIDNSNYQILKVSRPESAVQKRQLLKLLQDPNTLYAYPDGKKITVVQFEKWNHSTSSLQDLGIELNTSPKMFKRIKTFNRSFRAFYSRSSPVNVLLIDDLQHCSYVDFIDREQAEMLFDGAFILSQKIIQDCMNTFDTGTKVFDEDFTFTNEVFNRNTEVGEYYRSSKIFNARIFGEMNVINEGDYTPYIGAIKGQAYTDLSGACDYYGVDVIAPYSAFKQEANIVRRSFFLIEPQNAKLGQMFSDGQTIVNLPAVYDWHYMRDSIKDFYDDMMDRLTNNQVLDQWSDMSFARFASDHPKMFDETDVNALTMWNVRAWLMCGGKLSSSPWLFEQMGKNLLESMRPSDERKLRFPVPCAARALVITESLLRAIKGLRCDGEGFFGVEPGTARWDKDLSVLVVNDLDYIEMYPSHGGCDLDDFFQIYWRTIDGQKKIIICRSPNDWGEYTIFDYIEGDWFSTTTYGSKKITFPVISGNPDLWPKRLSEAIADGDVSYVGLPTNPANHTGEPYTPRYLMDAIEESSSAADSVGINVNARQLWSDAARRHRPEQLCSMEDCIDAGVQGGTDEQIAAVIADGQSIIDYLVLQGYDIDKYLWISKHQRFNPELEPNLIDGNVTYLHAVRTQYGRRFQEKYSKYAANIIDNSDYSTIFALGKRYLVEALTTLRMHRRSIAQINRNMGNVSPDHWSLINDCLLSSVEEKSPGHERSSYVLALYSATLQLPTSSGRRTDQPVMQPSIFPHLLESMQFYSLLGRLVTDETGKLLRSYDAPWSVYDKTQNKMLHFENPIKYQQWYFNQEESSSK